MQHLDKLLSSIYIGENACDGNIEIYELQLARRTWPYLNTILSVVVPPKELRQVQPLLLLPQMFLMTKHS